VASVYLIAWMTKDQTVQFRNDINDRTSRLLQPGRQ
jgi:murein L,D-transpeptidase YcbB/YkuD